MNQYTPNILFFIANCNPVPWRVVYVLCLPAYELTVARPIRIYTTLHNTTPHRTTPHRTIPNHTKPHQTTPNHTKPHQTTPNHNKPHQTTPNHTKPHQTTPNHTKPHERTFSIKINTTKSNPYKLKHGVPQGSILSPILFAIYLLPIKYIINRFLNIKYNLYVDDIEMHTSTKYSIQLQNCLNEINNWLINNYLLLNIKRTELININMTNSTESFPGIYINNIILLPTNSAKYLGLHFNIELNFGKHIIFIRQTTTAQLFNLRQLLPYMNTITTTLLTHSLIISRRNIENVILF